MTDLTVYFELAWLSFPLQNEIRFKIKQIGVYENTVTSFHIWVYKQ